jgi:transposase
MVFGIGPATRIYLAAGATDMRKGFEGLHGWCATFCRAIR